MHPRHLHCYPLQLEYQALNVSMAISSHLLVVLAPWTHTHNAFHSSPGVKVLPRFEGAQILDTLAGVKLVSHLHPLT